VLLAIEGKSARRDREARTGDRRRATGRICLPGRSVWIASTFSAWQHGSTCSGPAKRSKARCTPLVQNVFFNEECITSGEPRILQWRALRVSRSSHSLKLPPRTWKARTILTLGLPKCDEMATFAPFSSKYLMVGTEARMPGIKKSVRSPPLSVEARGNRTPLAFQPNCGHLFLACKYTDCTHACHQ
jgi:hypothetical protein